MSRILQRLSRTILQHAAHKPSALALCPSRLLQCSSVLKGPPLKGTENITSYEFLKRDPKYQSTLAPLTKDFHLPERPLDSDEFTELLARDEWNTQDVLDQFVRVSYFVLHSNMDVNLSEPCFNSMVTKLIEALPLYSFDGLCKILFCLNIWPRTPTVKSENFHRLWMELDKACQSKFSEFDHSQLLILLDHWYHVDLLRLCHFGEMANRKLLKRVTHRSHAQIIQSLFYVNARRYFPIKEVVGLQVYLEKKISALSIEEVGICAMAFFKSQKRIVSFNLMEMMIRKLITNAESAHNITITCIAKAIRMGLHLGLIPLHYQMLEKLYPRVKSKELSDMATMHLILAGTNVQMPHHGIMASATEQLISNIKNIRLKELERLCMALQMFKWPKELPGITENIYQTIIDEIKSPEREKECNIYPRSFTALLHYLSVLGLYDYELANRALSHEFLNIVYMPSVKASGFEILSLDIGLEIECPDYSGARLSEKARSVLSREISQTPLFYNDFLNRMDKGSYSDKKFKEIAASLTKVLGADWSKKMYIGHALPNYFRPDIFIKLSDDCEQVEDIPEGFGYKFPGEIKRPDSPNWISLVYGCRALMIRNTETEVIGSLAMKLRMIEKLGYHPVLILSSTFPENVEDQAVYISNMLEECKRALKSRQKLAKVNL
ncbi:FAST kinase domain-containing protein 5, mitochondrial [Neocloeon triangulifer]|uniref:FAST kinase domain-containing protein 5, mitochondrial n=1 Tax=Neocloeon triangulifer TaxID=2078957 RepID=UPI00286ED37D|nr:FAST kinase domain-containing protein 5, mitochondrial [Neocloeon triangulifer]